MIIVPGQAQEKLYIRIRVKNISLLGSPILDRKLLKLTTVKKSTNPQILLNIFLF